MSRPVRPPRRIILSPALEGQSPTHVALNHDSSDLGLELKDTTIDMLGRAKSVKVQKENTVIVDGAGDKDKIQGHEV